MPITGPYAAVCRARSAITSCARKPCITFTQACGVITCPFATTFRVCMCCIVCRRLIPPSPSSRAAAALTSCACESLVTNTRIIRGRGACTMPTARQVRAISDNSCDWTRGRDECGPISAVIYVASISVSITRFIPIHARTRAIGGGANPPVTT
jgi:hypothetical protein